jgi:hypothetical protein
VRTERAQLFLVLPPRVLDRLAAERRDDRKDEDGLRDHHGARREEQPELAQRAGTGEQEIDHQADHHGRQAHQRIQEHDDRAPPRESADGDRRTERQAEQGRERDRAQAHAQAEQDDFAERGVAGRDQPKGGADGFKDGIHRSETAPGMLSGASGARDMNRSS